jgi:hypothetical protein
MNARILIAVVITILLFGLYSWWSTKTEEAFDINSQTYSPAPVITPTEVSVEDRQVSPGGPNSPNQAPRKSQTMEIVPEERPFDPQDQLHESADLPERLRHPERVYSPGLMNENTEDAIASGVANSAQQVTNNAYQTFSPEFAMNGGSFLDNGVMANDAEMPTHYSAV